MLRAIRYDCADQYRLNRGSLQADRQLWQRARTEDFPLCFNEREKMNSTEEIGDIEFEARPAFMGWSIIAICDGEPFIVEGGLISPESRLKYWQQNIGMVATAIARAKAVL